MNKDSPGLAKGRLLLPRSPENRTSKKQVCLRWDGELRRKRREQTSVELDTIMKEEDAPARSSLTWKEPADRSQFNRPAVQRHKIHLSHYRKASSSCPCSPVL